MTVGRRFGGYGIRRLTRVSGRPGGTAAFTPTDTDGCVLWIPETSLVELDGSGNVESVESQVASDATQVSMEQPTPSARPVWNSSNAAFGGEPTMDFDGVSHWLHTDALAALVSGEDMPFTIMLACDFADAGNSEMFWNLSGSGGFHRLRRRGDDLDRSERRDDGNVQVTVSDGFPVSADPAVHTIVFSGTAIAWYRANSLLLSGAQDVGTLTVTRMTWGARDHGASDFFGGSIAGAAFWPRAIADEERNENYAWFANRFDL